MLSISFSDSCIGTGDAETYSCSVQSESSSLAGQPDDEFTCCSGLMMKHGLMSAAESAKEVHNDFDRAVNSTHLTRIV